MKDFRAGKSVVQYHIGGCTSVIALNNMVTPMQAEANYYSATATRW